MEYSWFFLFVMIALCVLMIARRNPPRLRIDRCYPRKGKAITRSRVDDVLHWTTR
jgi:hypothetical protein